VTKQDLPQALPRLTQFVRRFGPLLDDHSRVARAEAYSRGLLLDADGNKTAETIALNAYGGDVSQVRMTQHFRGQSPWPYRPLRAELVRWVDDACGDPEGVLLVDESGAAKCGDKRVGVARQYCGATGEIDNCRGGVSLAYASRHGHTLLDTRLDLPEEDWAKDTARRPAAGVPPALQRNYYCCGRYWVPSSAVPPYRPTKLSFVAKPCPSRSGLPHQAAVGRRIDIGARAGHPPQLGHL